MSFGKRHVPSAECPVGCFGCKLLSIRWSGELTPNRTPEVYQQREFEQKMSRDNDAYKRLRKEGFQPSNVLGAADVEQFATSKFEVESGYRLSTPAVGNKYDEAPHYRTHGGLQPLPANA